MRTVGRLGAAMILKIGVSAALTYILAALFQRGPEELPATVCQ